MSGLFPSGATDETGTKGSVTEFANDSLYPFLALEIELDSGIIRLWNGYDDLEIDGESYIGAGTLLQISAVEETGEIAAKGVTMTLAGLSTEIISLALAENYQNRTARVYVGAITEAGEVQSSQIFAGRLDVMTIEESGELTAITITAENRLIDLERPRSRRYTSEDQKALYPGDLGLDYVNDLQDKVLDWGRPTS